MYARYEGHSCLFHRPTRELRWTAAGVMAVQHPVPRRRRQPRSFCRAEYQCRAPLCEEDKESMTCRDLLSVALCGFACAAQAATITFDFDTATPALGVGQSAPFVQTANGLTASFTSLPGFGGFSVQTDSSTGFSLSQFSGHYLYPNSLTPGPLDIAFSSPLDSISFIFATADFHQVEVPTTIRLTAFVGSTGTPAIGSTTAHGVYGGDTMPMGTLSFSSNTPFNMVEISILRGQPAATGDFLVDNISVTTAVAPPTAVPEPMTAILSGLGLLAFALVRRRCA